MEKKSDGNSLGLASGVLGIVGIVVSLISPLAIILGIISLVFGIKQNKVSKNGWSKTGITLSIITIILSLISIVVVIYLYQKGALNVLG